jgi:hypothetical protein
MPLVFQILEKCRIHAATGSWRLLRPEINDRIDTYGGSVGDPAIKIQLCRGRCWRSWAWDTRKKHSDSLSQQVGVDLGWTETSSRKAMAPKQKLDSLISVGGHTNGAWKSSESPMWTPHVTSNLARCLVPTRSTAMPPPALCRAVYSIQCLPGLFCSNHFSLFRHLWAESCLAKSGPQRRNSVEVGYATTFVPRQSSSPASVKFSSNHRQRLFGRLLVECPKL